MQHGGKELSYLNLFDAEAAWRLVHQLGDRPAAVIVKHANPCGVAVADDITEAYVAAHECDPVSAFGGIVALNRPVPDSLADALAPVFTEVVVAPGLRATPRSSADREEEPAGALSPAAGRAAASTSARSTAGCLVQYADTVDARPRGMAGRHQGRADRGRSGPTSSSRGSCARRCRPTPSSSSATNAAVGIGAGQQNRVDSARIAAARGRRPRPRAARARSDAFFPFRDGLDAAAEAGVAAVIQPGGSIRDEEVIAAADEHGLAMVFTGERHFRH